MTASCQECRSRLCLDVPRMKLPPESARGLRQNKLVFAIGTPVARPPSVRIAMPFFAAAACAALVAGACGGTTSSIDADDAGTDGASGDASADVSHGDGGCVNPVEGAACSSSDTACGPSGDPCCIGYVWMCDATTHRWVKEGLGCACSPPPDASDAHAKNDGGPWACGSGATEATCGGDQYCQDHPPGIPGPDGSVLPDAYQCLGFPSSCAANPTCACVVPTLSGGSCTVTSCEEHDGHVVVHCMGV